MSQLPCFFSEIYKSCIVKTLPLKKKVIFQLNLRQKGTTTTIRTHKFGFKISTHHKKPNLLLFFFFNIHCFKENRDKRTVVRTQSWSATCLSAPVNSTLEIMHCVLNLPIIQQFVSRLMNNLQAGRFPAELTVGS